MIRIVRKSHVDALGLFYCIFFFVSKAYLSTVKEEREKKRIRIAVRKLLLIEIASACRFDWTPPF